MTAGSMRELVRRFYTDVVSRGDLGRVEEFIGPDYVDHNAEGSGRGPDVFRRHMKAVRHTFPDLTLEIQDIIVEGDRVVTRVSGHGTHRGEWMGIVPSGAIVRLKAINIDRVENGMIVEHWGEADTVGMLLQMGVDPFAGRRL